MKRTGFASFARLFLSTRDMLTFMNNSKTLKLIVGVINKELWTQWRRAPQPLYLYTFKDLSLHSFLLSDFLYARILCVLFTYEQTLCYKENPIRTWRSCFPSNKKKKLVRYRARRKYHITLFSRLKNYSLFENTFTFLGTMNKTIDQFLCVVYWEDLKIN